MLPQCHACSNSRVQGLVRQHACSPFFRYQDSSADDAGLDTDDELSSDSSGDGDNFMEKEAHKHLPNDSEGQLSSSS